MKWIQQHKIFAMAVAVAAVLSVWYITGTVKAVNRYVEQFNATYEVKEEPEGQGVNMYRVPGYHELLKEKGLLSSQVKLARTDSIGLFLNLPDSVAQLMIKGVAVRSIPLQKIGLPSLFSRTSQEALYEWLSEPVLVHTLKATIAKEPVNVVQAPKDSSDAVPLLKPDTTNREPVFFMLGSDRGLRLYFYQTERGGRDSRAAFAFEWADRWQEVKQNLRSVFAFRVPPYVPTLRIGISKEDAKVLYRALPEKGRVVITY